ncbi:DUF3108 domain-containing protein [Pelagibacterium halotolerans]|uniref:DUF3108 domain-containing protein n=1 Tax=Pelagibacterium halotolerans TaxID=531813 RepID=UPI00384DD474
MRQLAFSSLLAAGLTAIGFTTPAFANEAHALARYVISLGGINVAYMNVRLDVEGESYRLDLSADVTGLAQVVSQGAGSVNSGGRVTSTGLASSRFYLETRSQGERFSLETRYSGGNASDGIVSPPLAENPDRIPVTSSHRTGVNDPLAAFILRGPALDSSLCNRRFDIFTGIERFDMALRYADSQEATSTRTGYQGPVVLCTMRYIPISGHFTSSEITSYLADSTRMMTWYMPLDGSDFYIPYRVLMGTSFGDLSMVLVDID